MKVFIYILKHPETEEIRYVGLTRFPVKRLYNEINYPHSTHLKNWISSLKKSSLKPVMEIVEESEEGLACASEKKWITEMKDRGCRLLNYSDGGECGYKCSIEWRDAISAATKGKKKPPQSAETRAKISAAHKGTKKPWSSERLVALNKSRIGIPLRKETKEKISTFAKKRGITEEHRQTIRAAAKTSIRQSKFTDEQKAQIKFLLEDGYSLKVISQTYGMAIGTLSNVRSGEIWAKIAASDSMPSVPVSKTIKIVRNVKGQYERAA